MLNHKSLKSGILVSLIIPLIFFITVETVLSYFVTLHYVSKTYDRWLLDSARALAQEIKINDSVPSIELPLAALEIVKWDDLDKTYFKVYSQQKGLLAGDQTVPDPVEPVDWSNPVFFDHTINNEAVRLVSMRITKPDSQDSFFVHIGETLNKRNEMMRDILLADLIPQIVLVFIASLYLLIGLKRGLKPLHILANEIAKRSPRDLSPIAETHVFSEVRTLTDTINDLLQRLDHAIAAQQRFVANAAHQLRTPLAGFVVQAERAAREQDLAAMQPALKQMQTSADRLSHTVTQLLVLAKAEPVDGMSELKPIDLYGLVKATCLDWATKVLHKRIDLSFDCQDSTVPVLGDSALLTELLNNLLDNAILYTNPNGLICIQLAAKPNPTLTITDNGPGIPAHEASKVFERFYRIPGSQGIGCGLGLAIVKEIAELHHASLTLDSSGSQGGSQFKLVFPAF
jgi:two-component system, OmpR family, sensor histidine kinase TctE